MKKIFVLLFWAMLVIIPQSVNAYIIPLNMSLDLSTTYVSKGDTFSVTWDIGLTDYYSELDSLYPQGWTIDLDIRQADVRYNGNIINLISVNYPDSYSSPFETFFESGGITLNRIWLGYSNPISLGFEALQNGYTDLYVEAFLYSPGDLFSYDPTDPNANNGWVQHYEDISLEGSTTSRINVPEPASILLLGLGLLGLAGVRRKIKK